MAIGLYLLLGAFAGFIAGLFGVGGGLIIVPVLLWAFTAQGYDPTHLTHLAVGTSLATIMITSISSVNAHHRRGAVRWAIFRQLAPGLMVGAVVGAFIADQLSAPVLQLVIGSFALWVAWTMFAGRKQVEQTEHLPSVSAQRAAGGVIGMASAVFGIGGGSLTVPYLTRYGVVMQQAVATSSACGLPIAVAGALGFMWFGHDTGGHLPAGSWGYVNVYAFLAISATSLITAQWGAKLAHHLPAQILRKLFAALLFSVGVAFVYRGSSGFF